MSFSFGAGLFFLVLALIAVVVTVRTKVPTRAPRDDEIPVKSVARGVTAALFALFAFFMIIASMHTVPVRNVGIVTSFNRPTGATTGSGLKFTWPWEEIADFDASLQTETHVGDWNKGCSVVRIGSLATACVDNRIQWRVKEPAAPRLYQDYKGSFDSLKNNFVNGQIQLALNAVFATYNPLNTVNLKTGQIEFDLAAMSAKLKDQLVKYMGSDIEVATAIVTLVHHDEKTEASIKQFSDVVAQARILEQKEANARKEKLVSDLQRAFLTPVYLQNKCIEESVKLGFAPGLCLMQSGIVNAPTNK